MTPRCRIIPLFIPHRGCPHRCVFCDQEAVTGAHPPTHAVLQESLDHALASCKAEEDVEVAFYGGSFTCLPLEEQEGLLGVVQPYLASGRVGSIRVSTRPDGLDGERLVLLKRFGVRTVELGVQSMDPLVLQRSGRGHGPGESVRAVKRLKETGFSVGVQLMVGLPGERTSTLLAGARKVASLGPDFMRIYPVLVMRNTPLARDFLSGSFRPLSLARAVVLAARMKGVFDSHKIPVIRIGLQPTPDLARNILAGPYHPAFGELVLARNMFRNVRSTLTRARGKGKVRQISFSIKDESLVRGPRNAYLNRLRELGLLDGVEVVFSPAVERLGVRLA